MRLLTTTILVSLLIYGCGAKDPKAEYSRLIRSEKAKNIRNDSIFFGFYFGMPNKAFYDHAWTLNRQGKIMDGVNNVFILYRLDDGELKHSGSMNFYPDFYNNKVFKMRMEFNYDAWAPWNKSQSADSLLPDVLNFYKTWYPRGNPFITIVDSVRGTIHVKVDGNRRILIGKFDERLVKAEITDLTVEEELLKVAPK